jgi:hypothetical protein
MKSKFISMAATVALLVGCGVSARATAISGSISFNGTFTQNGGGSDLSAATSLSVSGTTVGSASGDLSGATLFSFASPIYVNGNTPLLVGGNLWSVKVGTYFFWLVVDTEVQGTTTSTALDLAGTGTLKSTNPAFSATAGTWSIDFKENSPSSFTWQSASANIPDGGTTVLLLGVALSAMGLFRKKLIA